VLRNERLNYPHAVRDVSCRVLQPHTKMAGNGMHHNAAQSFPEKELGELINQGRDQRDPAGAGASDPSTE
jgi:hypothetical protein